MSFQHIFETLKPNSQETAQNFEKRVLQKCLRHTFYTQKPVNPFHFLKKHHNRCTLLWTSGIPGGCTGCTCIPPPPAMCIPPPPQPERLVMRKDEQWATRKKCKFVYLRLDNFLPRIIIYKKQSFNFLSVNLNIIINY